MDKDSKFTRDKEGFVAVRTIAGKEALPAIDKDYMFGRDTNGNIAVRVIGSAGSVDEENVIIKTAEMPAASEEEYGKMRIFDGATTSEYTHGYIYECVGAGDPVVYSWVRIDVQPAAKLGRYLSGWNCATGLATTNPQESPYEYTTGDYFLVKTVAADGATNYRPDGSSYVIEQASTTVETSVVSIGDTYLYDGTSWTLLKTGSAVTSINGQVGDVSIKSVNGNSLLGSGNLDIDALPSQTGQSGKFLTTDGTDASWSDKPLINKTKGNPSNSLAIGNDTGSSLHSEFLCIGKYANVNNSSTVKIGCNGGASGWRSTAIGAGASTGGFADYAIQLGYNQTNRDANTFKVANGNGNFEMMSADGTIPEARLADTTNAQEGDVLTLDSNGNAVWQAGSGGLPDQTGQAGKVLTTNGTDASWESATTITMRTWGADE